MTMPRIATSSALLGAYSGVTTGQAEIDRLSRQASSQKVAQDLKGFGGDAARLISSKALEDRFERRTETLKALEARAEVEAAALDSLGKAVQQVREAMGNAIANQNGAGFRDALELALATAFNAANTTYAGEAVFGGIGAYQDATQPRTLDQLALDPDTSLSFPDRGVPRQVRIEDDRTIQLSRTAQEVFQPFVDFVRQVRVWENANGAIQGQLNAATTDWLRSQLPGIDSVQRGVFDSQAANGTVARQIEIARDANEARKDTFMKAVAGQENVNLSEVAAKLSAAQLQYQASASVFGQLKDLNLLQYLR
jgi:flagellar hook-associated protein 3 FlgL